VGLVARDRAHNVLSADRSARQESKILETLAYVEGRGDQPIPALVSAHAPLLPKGSTVILITPTTSRDLLFVADDLQRRKLRPIVLLLHAHTFGGADGADELALALETRGIPFRLVACGAEVSQALAGIGRQGASQETPTWQSPTLSRSI
jgi:uncharacterized protein (DUF58 family)